MEHMVEVNHLVKTYGKGKVRAVDDLSLYINQGEILGLLGPNGSGKSTTINCLLSLLSFQSGEIRVFGKEMQPNAYDIKKKIGVVFQEVAVFEELTVYENINYFCGLYITDKKIREEYVNDAIRLVGLQEFQKFRPKQLSGGLLRRLNIACGIAHKPEFIILDEPTVAVDPQSRNHILEGIRKLQKQGATVLYTSHYMEEVEQLCSRIVIIDKGKVIASGTKEELIELIHTSEKVTIELTEIKEEQILYLRELEHVKEVLFDGSKLLISYETGEHNLSRLVDYLKKEKISYTKIFSELPSLNDVFLELTGKELRD
ncbi:MAG: ABC transporter ATP-binding protein [Firmicutes bacterium]|nr:ABC transporter ATP-binding protein [Bacillota bacterium]